MKREGVTKNKSWGEWVRARRKEKKLTRRHLAHEAGIDPSYMTLIERDGYTPARTVTECIGTVLGNPDEALIVAGYVPATVNKRKLLLQMAEDFAESQLSPNSRQLILRLKDLDKREQEKVAPLLLSLLDGYLRNNVSRSRLKVVTA